MEEKRERRETEREREILCEKITNEPEVFYKDVTSSLYRVEITLFFPQDFRCSESTIHYSETKRCIKDIFTRSLYF